MADLTIGGTITAAPRACSDCGMAVRSTHDMADGRRLCTTCWYGAMRAAKTCPLATPCHGDVRICTCGVDNRTPTPTPKQQSGGTP